MPSFDYNILETLGSLATVRAVSSECIWYYKSNASKTNTFVHKDMWVEGDHAFQEI